MTPARGFRWCVLALVPLTGVSSTCAAQVSSVEEWRRTLAVVGAPMPPWTGDFDGDGVVEIVTPSRVQSFVPFGQRIMLYVHHADTEYERVVTDELEFAEAGVSGVLRRSDRDALMVTRIVQGDEGPVPEILLLSGAPLQEERRIQRYFGSILDVSDIDADGGVDSLEYLYDFDLGSYVLRLLDFDSGAIKWSIPLTQLPMLALGQLDADAPREVVIGPDSSAVFDGSSGFPQWTPAVGLLAPLAGDVLSSSAGEELLAMENGTLTIRSSGAFQVLAQPPTDCCSEHLLFDMDSDGGLDYVRLSMNEMRVSDFNSGTQRTVSLQAELGSGYMVGHVDADPAPEVIAYRVNEGEPSVRVLDSASGLGKSAMRGARQGQFAAVVGDVDGDGQDEIASIVDSVLDGRSRLEVRHADSGDLLRATDIPAIGRVPEGTATSNMLLAQMDADPNLEIVFSHYGGAVHRLAVHDGSTLDIQWSRVPRDADQNALVLHHLAIDDVDADGENEVLAVTPEARLHVFDASSGLLEWRSNQLESDYSQRLAVVQFDSDPAREVMVWTGILVAVFDGQTRELQWLRSFADIGGRFFVESARGRCAFGFYLWTRPRVYDCASPDTFRELELDLDTQVQYLEALPERGAGYLAIIERELVYLDADGGSPSPIGPLLASHLDSGVSAIDVIGRKEGVWNVVLANDAQLRRLRITTPILFGDGFE